jgi:hypothetical protein
MFVHAPLLSMNVGVVDLTNMDDFVTTITQAHNEVMEALRWNATEIMEGPGVLSGVRDFVGAVEWEEPFFKWQQLCSTWSSTTAVIR